MRPVTIGITVIFQGATGSTVAPIAIR